MHGRIAFQGRDLDDFVILRSDDTAIYNMAVVSDDIAMDITHVIRGDDHISNTPKQIALYRALGRPLPVFAHVPMILGTDGKKLSKRHGATAVGDYQEQGILPLAMRNFLALLGWSPGGDREIMPEDEMIRLFTLEGIQKKAAVFDPAKLEWMNGAVPLGAARRRAARAGAAAPGAARRERRGTRPPTHHRRGEGRAPEPSCRWPSGWRCGSIRRARRSTTKGEALIKKMGPAFGANLRLVVQALAALSHDGWQAEPILDTLKALAEARGLKLGDVMQPVRVALTGSTVSEPVNELLAVVGRPRSLARLEELAAPSRGESGAA